MSRIAKQLSKQGPQAFFFGLFGLVSIFVQNLWAATYLSAFPPYAYPSSEHQVILKLQLRQSYDPPRDHGQKQILRWMTREMERPQTEAEQALFWERSALFLREDRKPNQTISLDTQAGEKRWLQATESGEWRLDALSSGEWRSLEQGLWQIRIGDSPCVPVQWLGANGISIVSDIDDTIKLTDVSQKPMMLRRTFLEPFVPFPEMSQFYRAVSKNPAVRFHYVSQSPWQLQEPLAAFLSEHYPSGTLHLRPLQWFQSSFWAMLLGLTPAHKEQSIADLLRHLPQRKFLLIGDAAEKDATIYSSLRERYPEQVKGIWIRKIPGQVLADKLPGIWYFDSEDLVSLQQQWQSLGW